MMMHKKLLLTSLAWVSNYNGYITNAWDENMHKHEDVDKETVDDFIDITQRNLHNG